MIFSAIYYFLIYINKIDLSMLTKPNDLSNHFNFITVNSVFVGFLFSSLSMIVGLSGMDSIVRLEKGGFMENIYENITYGITFSFISIICSLIMIFLKNSLNNFYFFVNVIIPSIELLGLLLTIIVFLKSVKDIKLIIKVVRKKVKKLIPQDEDLQETLKLLKK